MNLGVEDTPATTARGLHLFIGRARRARVLNHTVPPHGAPIRIGSVAPSSLAAIDRVPLPVRGSATG